MRRRVVVTGMGCINPLGHDVATMWSALLDGQSGVKRISLFDASNFPTKIASEVRDWSIAAEGEEAAVWETRGRHTRFAAGAARQAVRQSGVLGTVNPTRLGIYLGAGEGQQDFFNFAKMMCASVGERRESDDPLDLKA